MHGIVGSGAFSARCIAPQIQNHSHLGPQGSHLTSLLCNQWLERMLP